MAQVAVINLDQSERYASYLQRWRGGEWRDKIFHDLIVEDAMSRGPEPVMLDIGCGTGFDDGIPLQESLARHAGRFVGLEPDPAVEVGQYFDEVHRSTLEDADLPAASIDVAYAVMVLEHLGTPQVFWDKIHKILKPGGVFWGLTVDARHPFCMASLWSERLGLKEFYMSRLHGERGVDRYLNYPVHYKSNSPKQLRELVGNFSSCEVLNFSRTGQMRGTVPNALHPVTDRIDGLMIRCGLPGPLLAVRVVK